MIPVPKFIEYHTKDVEDTPIRVQLNVRNKKLIVGFVDHEVFFKAVRGSVHFLRKPPAIAVDKQVWDTLKEGVTELCVLDTETGLEYRTAAQTFNDYSLLIERGHGVQLALPMEYWGVSDPTATLETKEGTNAEAQASS